MSNGSQRVLARLELTLQVDSAQGTDKVDGHRAPLWIASPYANRGVVNSSYYTPVNVTKTSEQILGARPMNQQDRAAVPMFDAFTNKPDLTPYTAVPNNVPIDQGVTGLIPLNPPAGSSGTASQAATLAATSGPPAPPVPPADRSVAAAWARWMQTVAAPTIRAQGANSVNPPQMSAAVMAQGVARDQTQLATPCSEWDIAALLEHMSGGSAYSMDALGVPTDGARWPDPGAVTACVDALRRPGVLEQRCMSPAGFEWSVADAVAGTAMDQLIHTWDLAVAIGTDRNLDAEVVDAVAAMLLPQMPEIGRQAGLVGPEVPVPAGASTQDRLLGAMGRNPAL